MNRHAVETDILCQRSLRYVLWAAACGKRVVQTGERWVLVAAVMWQSVNQQYRRWRHWTSSEADATDQWHRASYRCEGHQWAEYQTLWHDDEEPDWTAVSTTTTTQLKLLLPRRWRRQTTTTTTPTTTKYYYYYYYDYTALVATWVAVVYRQRDRCAGGWARQMKTGSLNIAEMWQKKWALKERLHRSTGVAVGRLKDQQWVSLDDRSNNSVWPPHHSKQPKTTHFRDDFKQFYKTALQ